MARILIIDDDEAVLSSLMAMLELDGYDVVGARGGRKGLALFREKTADLVITDIFMPEKEGVEIITELKRGFPEVKIIAISGGDRTASQDYLPVAEKLGAVRNLRKPFDPPEFLEAVREVLKTPSRHRASIVDNMA